MFFFNGGPGEAAHKTFVKSAGQKLKEECANLPNKLHMMLSLCAVQNLTECSIRLVQVGSVEVSNEDIIHSKHQENDDDVQVLLSGQYEINVSQAVINEMQTEHTVTVAWLTQDTDKNNNLKYCRKLPRYVPYKCTYAPYNGTFGASNQGQTLDV